MLGSSKNKYHAKVIILSQRYATNRMVIYKHITAILTPNNRLLAKVFCLVMY